ncbi:MAG: UDP-N-acetylmuramoylalanine--D-glutamate ligase (EC [uncultured Thiotrichaceae bacterium]|uniref:UDP-N-acetylmuramoylalanine--D-glutamate ligase n=1 Tax=uncultured Thiotrichaceae bacterium TaxID=298394 RepID=A0A6S6TB89_9GAMM|nr:MAG: UDP-N-acetylmuramoylalanine--D-glutamate ligase (EC [uncultured Thiotrichaceae bacterium]
MDKQLTHWDTLIVGLGKTGLSVAQFLRDRDVPFAVADSRENPPGKEDLLESCPDVPVFFGAFSEKVFTQARQLIVNPGVSVHIPEIQAACKKGAEVIGDIELFARSSTRPVIGITGSNGKTTVTKLLTLMAQRAGLKVEMGGNIGIPVLDLLNKEPVDLYVLELSSFQLETTYSLNAISAVILNITEDHLDRYDGFAGYASAKAKIYEQTENVLANRDDDDVMTLAKKYQPISFGLNKPERSEDFGISESTDETWLVKGKEQLINAKALKIKGKHNIANALAALALGDMAGIDMQGMLRGLRDFEGVEHRSQWVAKINQVNWYNDSKGTNVGATLAALSGLPGKTVLIAGGQGKGSDFTPLAPVVADRARAVILLGEDAEKISVALGAFEKKYFVKNMDEAVQLARDLAEEGDNVLLSPACASFDMYRSYEERGEIFMHAVRRLS